MRITGFTTHDVRFPTSLGRHGSDAMHPDPDYSAAYVVLETDTGHTGHGHAFTIGRGTEIVCAAAKLLAPILVGRTVETLDMGALARELNRETQVRWIGPESGVLHLATAAVLNAAWDLASKAAGQPLWQFVSSMSPEALVDLVDWRHLTDALTPDQALVRLEAQAGGRAEVTARLLDEGLPAYTTSPGWIGYTEDERRAQCAAAAAAGFTHVKAKVGESIEADRERLRIIRSAMPDAQLMTDANQVWEVDEAIGWVKALDGFDIDWIEEPTSPDDVLGHAKIAAAVKPVRVATGEMCANRVMFKQFLAFGAMQVCQIDACRLASVNEVFAVLLLADRFGVPVCPHAGGVGLCEYVQHLSAIDAICVTGTTDGRVVEYADHLHEHYVDPVVVSGGAYRLPTVAGYTSEMKPDSLAAHTWPDGPIWSDLRARGLTP